MCIRDRYSTTSSAAEQKLIRLIGLNRNLELHVLQIRDNIDKELAGIHWLAFGPNSFNSLVPFYARVSDTPTCYRDTKADFDPTKMYWLTTMTAVLDVYKRQKSRLQVMIFLSQKILENNL